MDFHMSEDMGADIGFGSTIIAFVSVGFCLFVLCASLWIYTVPEARYTIDRISFRSMIWSIVFGLGNDICYASTEPQFAIFNPSSVNCQVVMYFQSVTSAAVNYFITCIAVNLMLSIRFAFNSLESRSERWYVSVSLFVAFFVPIIPTASGHFGADPVYDACYFTAPTTGQRVTNFVSDVYSWQTLSTLSACVSVSVTLFTLFQSGRATAKALLQKDHNDVSNEKDVQIASASDQSATSGCTVVKSSTSIWRFWKKDSNKPAGNYRLQDQFSSIAIRVSLYPIVLIIINVICTVGDLYLSARGGVHTRGEYALFIAYYVSYGGRNLYSAIIGIFVDPGLRRGSQVAWHARRSERNRGTTEYSTRDEEEDIDLASALASMPYSTEHNHFSIEDRALPSSRRQSCKDQADFTLSFHGVARDHSPKGMTDEVDVVEHATADEMGAETGRGIVSPIESLKLPLGSAERSPEAPGIDQGNQRGNEEHRPRGHARAEMERARRKRSADDQQLLDSLLRL